MSSVSASALGRDLQNVARPVVAHGDDAAEARAVARRGREADEVGTVEFLFARRRQLLAPRVEFDAVQRLGRGARRNALHPRDQHVPLERPQRLEGEDARAGLVGQRAIGADRLGILGGGLDPHLAAHALRGAEHAEGK